MRGEIFRLLVDGRGGEEGIYNGRLILEGGDGYVIMLLITCLLVNCQTSPTYL